MLQTVQGYFIDDRFIPLQQAKIPSHVEVFVVVTTKPVVENNKKINANFPLYGCAKGKNGWISDDFNAPLEEMEEYM